MRASVFAIGLGAALVLGLGVWLGRTSPTPAAADSRGAAGHDPIEGTGPAPASRLAATSAPALSARAKPARTAPGLAADLVADDPKIRRAAVREVARSSDADPAVLLVASRDPDLEVAAISTEALGRLYADGQVSTKDMVACATDHAIPERVRLNALNGLGIVENVDAAGVLIELLSRGEVIERRAAAILLAHQDLTVAVPALISALGDADEYVRSNAIEALRSQARGRDFGSDAAAWRTWWQSRPR